jgi:16S rRNA processing protein RimM
LKKRSSLLAIGTVMKSFGIRGEVVVRMMTNAPSRFKRLKTVFLGRDEATALERRIEYVRIGERGVRIKLVEIPDRTSAEQMVGNLVFVEDEHAVPLKKGTHFVHDLVGLRVVDESGEDVGILTDVLKMPGHDVYVVDDHGREVMVPAVKEFVREIDVAARKIRVHLIEGMRGT